MATLDQLQPGQHGRIETLAGDPALVQRLYEIGLLEGEVAEVLGVSLLGDPIEIRVGNTRLSLRRAEAAAVTVTHLA
ncbi:FeoA family protein [Fimbriiglobus ruber]|uniref:Ferrous iron transport protein A n=1 Tax=Fimbriiglobus ruber TaxID=1908690 RepID=A0A225DRY4_9BACT|nr:ferrous iron transport protein A [Fimbriiglobus ruber]OWK39145.1 ferrous iron transport protein A [Fimbriiglobus ruber]